MYSIDDLFYFLKYPIKNKRFKYLNAGTMMGPVKKGIELLEELGVENEAQRSDQMDMIRYFTKYPKAFALDEDHHIFGVNGGRAGLELDDYSIKDGRLYSNPTKTWPALLHVPGKFFIGLDRISKTLGLYHTRQRIQKKSKRRIKQRKKNMV